MRQRVEVLRIPLKQKRCLVRKYKYSAMVLVKRQSVIQRYIFFFVG